MRRRKVPVIHSSSEKESQKIEIKSFVSASEMRDLEVALGQYVLYQNVLSVVEPDRVLYLAVRESVFIDLFEEDVGQLLLARQLVRLLTFDPTQEAIARWI